MRHEILIYNRIRRKIPRKLITEIILKILKSLKSKQPVELAVLIVDKYEIKRLNKVWRNNNYIPDELSFGLNSRKSEAFAKNKSNVLRLGEIVINGDKISDKKYLTIILIHGLLHLLGYSHEQSAVQAKKMEKIEEKLLKHLCREKI